MTLSFRDTVTRVHPAQNDTLETASLTFLLVSACKQIASCFMIKSTGVGNIPSAQVSGSEVEAVLISISLIIGEGPFYSFVLLLGIIFQN